MMLRIRRRGLPLNQIVMAIIVGVASGYYIWKTPLELHYKETLNKTKHQDSMKETDESVKTN
jgi:hypothetical protein